MKLGVLVHFGANTDIFAEFEKLKTYEFNCCQLCCWDNNQYTTERAEQVKAAAAQYDIEVTALWAGWSGPKEWNFTYGPSTLGLVPAAYRGQRLKELHEASVFAQKLGVTDVITHVGFLPENPRDPDFVDTVGALRNLAKAMEKRGQYFLFETGQETPVTMLRTIEAIGTQNLGINFDTANLILYGKANSADAISMFGHYVRNTHIKDGFYPTAGNSLGKQVQIGQGVADLPLIMKRLLEVEYDGPWIIEREISGPQQIADIIEARDIIRDIYTSLTADK
jgi:sugar phosphate isomerase/epimerase